MPISFFCSECQNLLRTPDDSAGTKVKCHRCGRVQHVPQCGLDLPDDAPQVGGSSADDSRGGRADNPFRERGSSPPAGVERSDNPYASPTAAGSVNTGYVNDAPRAGLPWERQGYSVRTFWETAKLVLGSPRAAFQRMHREGRLTGPFFFLLGGGLTGFFMAGFFLSILEVSLLSIGFRGMIAGQGFAGHAREFALLVVVFFTYGTVGATTLWLLLGSLAHLTLALLGESQCKFNTTLRAGGYALGAALLLAGIPACGSLIFAATAVVVYTIGLSAAHEIPAGKALTAVLAPLAFSCAGLISFAFFMDQVMSNGGF